MRYEAIIVARRINVSSSGHYFATVNYIDNTERTYIRRDYCLGSGFLALTAQYGDWNAPKYLEREVCRQLRALILDGGAVFFEYDADRNERTENLRYYDADHARWLAETLYATTGSGTG